MADFSKVRDQNEVVYGIWLKNPDKAKDIYFMIALSGRIAIEEGPKFPDEYQAAVLAKQYRVVPNTFDASGGVFVMFGDALAPGEKAPVSQGTSGSPAPRKTSWQFWK